jgi:hypothetical protein
MIPTDTAVDVEIERNKESIGGLIEENLHPEGIMLMV